MGSFVNALVWRVRQQSKVQSLKSKAKKKPNTPHSVLSTEYSVLRGRSMCPNCKYELAPKDLIPVISWLFLRGKCRYCKKPISVQYPVVELAMAVVFVVSYHFWPLEPSGGQGLLFGSWLIASVGLMALAVYDIKWMLLPNRILYPTLVVATAGQASYIIFYAADPANSFWLLALSILVASGVFWLLFHISKGKWIGYGDVRLGVVLGVLLASPDLAFLMIFTASVLGTLYSLPLMAAGKQKMASKIPFGPFLILGTFLVLLFGRELIDWYRNFL